MRKLLIIAAALALPLSGCATVAKLADGPAPVAQASVLDEKGAIAIETAYTASARAAALAIRTGIVTDPQAVQCIGALDRRAYAAVKGARAAYEAGQLSSYITAFEQADAAVKALLASFSDGANKC